MLLSDSFKSQVVEFGQGLNNSQEREVVIDWREIIYALKRRDQFERKKDKGNFSQGRKALFATV